MSVINRSGVHSLLPRRIIGRICPKVSLPPTAPAKSKVSKSAGAVSHAWSNETPATAYAKECLLCVWQSFLMFLMLTSFKRRNKTAMTSCEVTQRPAANQPLNVKKYEAFVWVIVGSICFCDACVCFSLMLFSEL